MSKQGDLKVSLDTMQAEEQLDGLAEQIRGLGESIGIGKRTLLDDYYLDEFLTVIDAYIDMHKLNKEEQEADSIVTAEQW